MSALAPLTDTPPIVAPGPTTPGQTIVPPGQQLARNPMLPQHPLGAYTDSQYEEQQAMLQQEISKRYGDLLQQLGYADDKGNFIPGSVETNAMRQKQDLERSLGLAADDVTKQAQNNGTLFSGIRGTLQARAEYPFANQEARLDADLPVQLQQLYEQAGGLMNEYTIPQNQLLGDAARRKAAAAVTGPGGDPGPTPPPPPGTITSPAPPTTITSPAPPTTITSEAPPAAPIGVAPPAGALTSVGPPAAPTGIAPPAMSSLHLPGGVANTFTTQAPGTPQDQMGPHQALADIHRASVQALGKFQAHKGLL